MLLLTLCPFSSSLQCCYVALFLIRKGYEAMMFTYCTDVPAILPHYTVHIEQLITEINNSDISASSYSVVRK